LTQSPRGIRLEIKKKTAPDTVRENIRRGSERKSKQPTPMNERGQSSLLRSKRKEGVAPSWRNCEVREGDCGTVEGCGKMWGDSTLEKKKKKNGVQHQF